MIAAVTATSTVASATCTNAMRQLGNPNSAPRNRMVPTNRDSPT